MSEILANAPSAEAAAPWWRFPIAWLAMGLPASAVVAATLSGVIAVRHADPVVDGSGHAAQVSSVQAGRRDATEPAEQARNHASLPTR